MESIIEILQGGLALHPKVAADLATMFVQNQRGDSLEDALTPRELEVLCLMVDGMLKKEIGDKLSVSFHTVDTHIRRNYIKLGVSSKSAAVAKAMRLGLVHPN